MTPPLPCSQIAHRYNISTLTIHPPILLTEHALKIYLYAAQVADDANKYHAITYEFVKESLLLYEGPITDSKAQVG